MHTTEQYCIVLSQGYSQIEKLPPEASAYCPHGLLLVPVQCSTVQYSTVHHSTSCSASEAQHEALLLPAPSRVRGK